MRLNGITDFLKKVVVAVTCASMLVLPYQAHSGFLEEYVQGASVNVNQPAVVQGRSVNVISGGGLYTRIPNRSFDPFTFSPPSFKAGCGGIDLYLGAFGFPSKDEMVAFLRQVGQAAGGIAFSIALQALSPQLYGTVTQYAEQIRQMTMQYRNSCTAAQTLFNTGPGKAVAQTIFEAGRAIRTTVSDETSGENRLLNFDEALANATGRGGQANNGGRVNPDGTVAPPPPIRNLTWYAITANDSPLLPQDNIDTPKNIIYNMLGTVVYTKGSGGGDAQPSDSSDSNPSRASGTGLVANYKPPTLTPEQAIGLLMYGKESNGGDASATKPISDLMLCKNGPSTTVAPGNQNPNRLCLDIVTVPVNSFPGIEKGLLKIFQDAADNVKSAIRGRTEVKNEDLIVLSSAADVDVIKAVNLAGSIRFGDLADNFARQYIEIAAYATAANYLQLTLDAVNKDIGSARLTNEDVGTYGENLKVLQERISVARGILSERRAKASEKVKTLASQASLLRDLERSMNADMNLTVAQNLQFNGGR